MSFINNNTKVIHCKVVYYGPSLGGKTTNIKWIYNQVTPNNDTKDDSFEEIERTIFFDFLPLEVGDVRGYKTNLHLVAVPGQVIYDARRKLLLNGIDGVIFVADSQAERMEENLQALRNLEKNLEQQGYDIRQIPLVFQYNKRNLPNILEVSELRSALNHYNAPDFEATANEGKGVIESLTCVSKTIINVLKGGSM